MGVSLERAHDGRSRSILVVDDEDVVCRVVARTLSVDGFDVLPPITSLAEVMPSIEASPPALILMDVTFGGRTEGIAAAREVTDHWGIPVVFISGDASPEVIAAASAAGAVGF